MQQRGYFLLANFQSTENWNPIHRLSLITELPRAQSEKPGNRLRVNDVLLMALLGHVSRTARNSSREFSRRRDSNLAHLKVSARRETKERHPRKRERKRKMERDMDKKMTNRLAREFYAFCRFSTVYQSHAKFIFLQVIDITHDGRRRR